MAAMTPCMRLYAHLGQSLEERYGAAGQYADWIATYAADDFESLVYATKQPTDSTNLIENILALEGAGAAPELLAVLDRAAANLRETPDSSIVFTDDHAPVERLINSIVLQFMLGGMEGLP